MVFIREFSMLLHGAEENNSSLILEWPNTLQLFKKKTLLHFLYLTFKSLIYNLQDSRPCQTKKNLLIDGLRDVQPSYFFAFGLLSSFSFHKTITEIEKV